jgi:hypothetical protein
MWKLAHEDSNRTILSRVRLIRILRCKHQRSRFEVPAVHAASSAQELQIEKRHWNHKFASARDFPKFVKVCAARHHELRKAGTGPQNRLIRNRIKKISSQFDFVCIALRSQRFSRAKDVLTF